MPRRTAGERLNRYDAKLDPDRIKEDLIRFRPGMLQKQMVTAHELENVELRTRAVLSQEDVPTIMYPAYYDFARTLYRLVNRFRGGGGLEREIQIQIDVWAARELRRSILVRIAELAFGLRLPWDQKPESEEPR